MAETIWGVDLGGTKVEGVVLNEKFEVLSRLRVPTEQQYGYDHILEQITKVIKLMEEDCGFSPKRIGIGTPGTMDKKTHLMKNSNTLCLNGQPLIKDLEKLTQLPIEEANDANCFALAETKMGIVPDVMPGAKVVFGVIMGTGAGGGLVVNGEIIAGRQGNGGEWGHNFLDESGGDCYCGKSGCVEMVIAGPALQRYYQSIGGKQLTMKEITKRYLQGNDELATRTIIRLQNMYAKAISVVLNIVDPDVIVLGGGLGNIDILYTEETKKKIEFYTFNDRLDTLFVKPKLGDSAGVFGAAMLVAS